MFNELQQAWPPVADARALPDAGLVLAPEWLHSREDDRSWSCRVDFRIATYNILASAYITPEWYPHTPPKLLDPAHRTPALIEHLVQLQADVVCLQEVEHSVFDRVARHFSALGYACAFAPKGRGKPDGCAVLFDTAVFTRHRARRVEYADGDLEQGASGHVAQIVTLEHERATLGVANTHLKWDPRDTPRQRQYGFRQIRQLLQELGRSECAGWIVCGDFNVAPTSNVVRALTDAGFTPTHRDGPAPTCNSNRRAKQVDYLLFDAGLRAHPDVLPAITDDTPLPGPDQPSDHLAVAAGFEWVVP